jgi:putative hydrolase of HD superfamily
MDAVVDFMIEVGKLKRLKRKGWLLRGVKDAETVSQHTFRTAVIAWLLGRKRGFDMGKVLKTAFVHDLCEVHTSYETPYEPLFFNFLGIKKIPTKKVFKKPPRLPKTQRIEWLLKKKKKEWLGLEKLISGLPRKIQEEITNLWICFDQYLTREGRFVNQVNKVENLLQATEYWLENKKFPITPWWVEIKEIIDDALLLEFIEELEKKYYSKS